MKKHQKKEITPDDVERMLPHVGTPPPPEYLEDMLKRMEEIDKEKELEKKSPGKEEMGD